MLLDRSDGCSGDWRGGEESWKTSEVSLVQLCVFIHIASKAYFQLWSILGAETLPKATSGDRTSWTPGWANHDEARPTYAKGGTWLFFFGHSITLYARAVRTILNHALIGEYRARFCPKSHPCTHAVNQTLRPELRVSQVHRKPNDASLPVLRRPC